MTRKKPQPLSRDLEFAGYKFQTSPEGTVIHRDFVDVKALGDHGADPIGDGTFRMVPSGDIVDLEERNRRLRRRDNPSCAPCGLAENPLSSSGWAWLIGGAVVAGAAWLYLSKKKSATWTCGAAMECTHFVKGDNWHARNKINNSLAIYSTPPENFLAYPVRSQLTRGTPRGRGWVCSSSTRLGPFRSHRIPRSWWSAQIAGRTPKILAAILPSGDVGTVDRLHSFATSRRRKPHGHQITQGLLSQSGPSVLPWELLWEDPPGLSLEALWVRSSERCGDESDHGSSRLVAQSARSSGVGRYSDNGGRRAW